MDYLECTNVEDLIKYFQKVGLLNSTAPLCYKCKNSMKFSAKTDNMDKFAWRCTKGCGLSSTLRRGSFLEGFKFDLHTFLKLVYHWAIKTPQKVVAKELKMSRNTLTAWFQKLRHVAVVAFEKDNVVLGGRNMVVEIDESLFIKVKSQTIPRRF
jgi:hypothetical protein